MEKAFSPASLCTWQGFGAKYTQSILTLNVWYTWPMNGIHLRFRPSLDAHIIFRHTSKSASTPVEVSRYHAQRQYY